MRAMVLDDGTTYTGVAKCRIVELDDETVDVDVEIAEGHYNCLYAFTGDETGGVALTDKLDDQVKAAIDGGRPDMRPRLYDALLALARACDIEVNAPREEP